MLYLGTTPLAGNIKSKLYTTSGTFVVPADVQIVWIDGSGGGGGGSGGNSTPGGGGGGGGPAIGIVSRAMAVVPGETLTVTVGAAGSGGAANNSGGYGGITSISGSMGGLYCDRGEPGTPGANPNGGNGGAINGSTQPAGGTAAGVSAISYGIGAAGTTVFGSPTGFISRYTSGGPGGALTFNGRTTYACNGQSTIITGGVGGASGGGGGAGGNGPFGLGGNGGSNGAAGSSATGYGCGGGGGSGNAAGGNGSPGFLQIYYVSAYTVA